MPCITPPPSSSSNRAWSPTSTSRCNSRFIPRSRSRRSHRSLLPSSSNRSASTPHRRPRGSPRSTGTAFRTRRRSRSPPSASFPPTAQACTIPGEAPRSSSKTLRCSCLRHGSRTYREAQHEEPLDHGSRNQPCHTVPSTHMSIHQLFHRCPASGHRLYHQHQKIIDGDLIFIFPRVFLREREGNTIRAPQNRAVDCVANRGSAIPKPERLPETPKATPRNLSFILLCWQLTREREDEKQETTGAN